MGVHTTTPKLPHFPAPATAIATVERHARAGAVDAGRLLEGAIAGDTPRRTGAAADAVQARVSRSAGGIVLRVAPNDKAHPSSSRRSARNLPNSIVWRFLDKGTGEYGPAHRVIARSKRGLVPVGGALRMPSGRGYAGRHIFDRVAAEYDGAVLAVLDRAITVAMREVAR